MLAFYYFIDDCNDARLNIPQGMLDVGNTIFLSFVADDKWEEGSMSNHVDEVAQKIKELKPDMYVAYSIGGQVGSMSTSLFNYLSSNSAETIANTILSWKYADGIDWDLEPPSGGAAGGYGKADMAKKLGQISQLVQAGGKHVTMAGFGAWAYDDSMCTLNGELISTVPAHRQRRRGLHEVLGVRRTVGPRRGAQQGRGAGDAGGRHLWEGLCVRGGLHRCRLQGRRRPECHRVDGEARSVQ